MIYARARVSIIAPPYNPWRVLIETMIYPGLGPSIFVDVSMADQVEHWIHSVLAVLPDSKVVSSILPLWRSIGVKTRYIMMVITCADSGSS